MCLIWIWGAVWGGCQPKPWRNGIILTPQVTQSPNIWANQCGYNYLRTAYQCSQILCTCIMWTQEAVWVGCQLQPWCNDIILTPQVTQNPKIRPKKCGYDWLRLLPYAQISTHQCSQTLWICLVWMGEAVVEVTVRLNHDIMTSFWLHKWPRTSKLSGDCYKDTERGKVICDCRNQMG
jgi:hypothetical protein